MAGAERESEGRKGGGRLCQLQELGEDWALSLGRWKPWRAVGSGEAAADSLPPSGGSWGEDTPL